MMMIVRKWGIIFWKLMKKVYCKPSKVNVKVTVKDNFKCYSCTQCNEFLTTTFKVLGFNRVLLVISFQKLRGRKVTCERHSNDYQPSLSMLTDFLLHFPSHVLRSVSQHASKVE